MRSRRWFCCLATGWLWLQPSQTAATDTVERVGDWISLLLPVSAAAATLAQKDYEGSRQFVYAAVVSQGSTHLLKRTVNRTRPDGGRYSFPSGHTSSAFLGSGFVHRRYGLTYAWTMHVAATYVGFSRVHADRHWTTDVLAGAAISLAACWLIADPLGGTARVSSSLIPGGVVVTWSID
jgi:membrane-associated phospholipid phosphatase